MKRRTFIKGLFGTSSMAALGACSTRRAPQGAPAPPVAHTTPAPVARDLGQQDLEQAMQRSRVALVKTRDRAEGVRRGMALLGLAKLGSGSVFLKPNFNSADPGAASTHEETILTTIEALRELGAGPMTLGDRSGMASTREVMKARDIFKLAKKHDFEAMVFDELKAAQWRHITPPGTVWERGFHMPTAFLDADFKVMMCCLKTHRYGGHFTMSLKNSVGLAAKRVPGLSHDFMRELHRSPDQRTLIADLNANYAPDLIVMDGVEAFVDGGPAEGDRAEANMMLFGTDRVAMDMLGVAMLRELGTNENVSTGPIIELEQIARAIELGVGEHRTSHIEVLTDDAASRALADTLIARCEAA